MTAIFAAQVVVDASTHVGAAGAYCEPDGGVPASFAQRSQSWGELGSSGRSRTDSRWAPQCSQRGGW